MDNNIRLEILGITFPAIKNICFHDEGFVDIRDRSEQLYEYYNLEKEFEYQLSIVMDPLASGKCMHLVTDASNITKSIKHRVEQYSKKEIYLMYSKERLKKTEGTCAIHTRAHEETHALDLIGRLDILEDKLFEEQRVRIDLNSENCETKAIIGSIYALKARGLSIWRTPLILDRIIDEDYIRAYKIYRKGKVSKKEYYIVPSAHRQEPTV